MALAQATRTEYTVIGNHVRLASHLAQIAGPDQILISDPTLAVPEVRELYRRIVTEIVAVGRAAGAPVHDDMLEQGMSFLDGVAPNAYSSLHHDLTQGKRLELEAHHGHVVRLAERHRVPAPTVFAVYAALLPYRDGPPRL